MTTVTNDAFLAEYTSRNAIFTYSRATAGLGISYLLDHDYKDVYLQAMGLLPAGVVEHGIHVLEFGCGAGMNLLHLHEVLRREGINVGSALGTDFSPVLIETARAEAKNCLNQQQREKTQFCVARNESLIVDISASAGLAPTTLADSFHFILGVNTIRYCHAIGKQLENARDIFSLLAPGGMCVVIDMNNRFPAFRSELKNKLRGKKEQGEECYVPSLEEYTAPFQQAGFEVSRSEHFCWIPHSAGRFMTGLLRSLSPILSIVTGSRAMRSLVVVKKPLHR